MTRIIHPSTPKLPELPMTFDLSDDRTVTVGLGGKVTVKRDGALLESALFSELDGVRVLGNDFISAEIKEAVRRRINAPDEPKYSLAIDKLKQARSLLQPPFRDGEDTAFEDAFDRLSRIGDEHLPDLDGSAQAHLLVIYNSISPAGSKVIGPVRSLDAQGRQNLKEAVIALIRCLENAQADTAR